MLTTGDPSHANNELLQSPVHLHLVGSDVGVAHAECSSLDTASRARERRNGAHPRGQRGTAGVGAPLLVRQHGEIVGRQHRDRSHPQRPARRGRVAVANGMPARPQGPLRRALDRASTTCFSLDHSSFPQI